jgi:hypothetical protein
MTVPMSDGGNREEAVTSTVLSVAGGRCSDILSAEALDDRIADAAITA